MEKMEKLICIKCDESQFLDPKKEICYRTGGLWCNRYETIVGKYDECLEETKGDKGDKGGKSKKGTKGGKKTGTSR